MKDEFNALIKIATWDLVPRPRDVNIVNCMWFFCHKEKANLIVTLKGKRLVWYV